MVQVKHGPETSYEERKQRRLQVVYRRQTHERQIFMQELKEIRRRKEHNVIKRITNLVGPTWLQALSVPQRTALDSLEFSIYQDILEGRPVRTATIMKQLGIYPRPNNLDLMNCVYLGRKDPKQMLAQLFMMTYGHPIEGKRASYCLHARLILSGILYLGLHNLLLLLRKRFGPDTVAKPPEPKPKLQKQPPLASPYLQDMIAVLYSPPKRRPYQPAPLPNLDDLNEPYEEDPPVPKPPPPPPPPPAPKKRLPRAYCDKLAGITNMEPYTSDTHVVKSVTQRTQIRRVRNSKQSVEVKKTYGINTNRPNKGGSRRRRLKTPSTGIPNAQYTINGVFKVNGKTVFVLGNVTILPPQGDFINGGYRFVNGANITIHCGFRGRPPSPSPDPCDCVKRWQDAVLGYVKETKCYCGHRYDYRNEGTFPAEELPYFKKATRFTPYQFNYHTIYNLDEKQLYIEKEFKRIWETESALAVDGAVIEKKDKKKKKARRSSKTCLGQNPTPQDYLKCALRHMRRINIAAKLPDIHLVPELKEWMRHRIYGPFTRHEKKEMLRKSTDFWQTFLTLEQRGFGHVHPRKEPAYYGQTTWANKQDLNNKFRKYTHEYKLELYRSYARVTNLMWATMCQAQFPDKKFREIYFSYLFARLEDLQLMHPYSSREVTERAIVLSKKRYYCIPDGIEQSD